jgi:catalase
MDGAKAAELAGTDPDYQVLDLYNAISEGNYPTCTGSIQLVSPAEVPSCQSTTFDMTKTWPKALYPLWPVGRIALDQNPTKVFAEIEQAAFSPSNMDLGIEARAEPMLQARIFAYPDTAR